MFFVVDLLAQSELIVITDNFVVSERILFKKKSIVHNGKNWIVNLSIRAGFGISLRADSMYVIAIN